MNSTENYKNIFEWAEHNLHEDFDINCSILNNNLLYVEGVSDELRGSCCYFSEKWPLELQIRAVCNFVDVWLEAKNGKK